MFRKFIAITKDIIAKTVSAINKEVDNLLSLFKNGEIIIIAPSQPAERLIKRSEIEEGQILLLIDSIISTYLCQTKSCEKTYLLHIKLHIVILNRIVIK
ncbi:MAG: hypothetical protein UR29_C0015G0006 [Candidatus Woesebacteria bacterium GW2011_GWC2_33_12]|uniref:Uncharacterized protein n=1 Tax=Candidatus Woesebacteria bacterium GW2011_GWB1_33_22 TaxID=1618566 RepID=A0A0G0BZG2_9BACT|nr:MAG: hypothetical protein UR29_C0015G0006 [Candidatus Woesebacteria bacterium GW2011_GWC2_33_12]KKP41841.1 MAG: hypothetical protein UR33_C0009G0035 [Candidatus Woesebacteria bacterium GW2011_GWA2_33_20]KKP44300.1 MAG: hypothetical protein UR35_C0009G0011 [Candidatus Woesebacteria bacterium GW2011_GWB1_33_22]KKP46058.1 MAG: hypothetical protein UR37_C0012G0010 [Microgenomates group bacterium GW2011_GWC1_33_28]KKP49947.1 MAG: hypothetical protein UR41_C0011G0009 [Candidatus Woesebacteria bact